MRPKTDHASLFDFNKLLHAISQMAASGVLACEIFVDELVIAGWADAGEVAAVDE